MYATNFIHIFSVYIINSVQENVWSVCDGVSMGRLTVQIHRWSKIVIYGFLHTELDPLRKVQKFT